MKFRRRDSSIHSLLKYHTVHAEQISFLILLHHCPGLSNTIAIHFRSRNQSKQLLVQIHYRSSIIMASSKPASISSPSTFQSQRTFYKFPELAAELRFQIGEHAVPGPRIVHVTSAPFQPVYCLRVRSDADINTMAFFDIMPEDQYPRVFDPEVFWGIRSHCPPPGLLGACRESFSVASKYYDRVFGTERGIAQTWFDFDRDFL
mgnify:CR=1 FL=1